MPAANGTGLFEQDDELLEEVRRCFQDRKSTTVVAAFRVHTVTHKQFSHKEKLKAKVVCISLKPENNGFKCRLSTIKLSTNEAAQVRDSWKLKQITSLRAPEPKADSMPQVSIHFTGSGTETFLFHSKLDRSAFLGCVLVYNQKTYQKKIECVGFKPTSCIALWRQTVSGSGTKATATKPEEVISIQDTKKEEAIHALNNLDKFIERSNFSLNNLKGFESYLQSQLFDLDSSNIHAILSNVEDVDGVVSRVNDTLEYIDDLEEWLNVFNTKLTHMRIDISTIEDRNNALETKSDNNVALLQELEGLQQSLHLDEVTLQNIIITNFNKDNIDLAVAAARNLHQLLQSIEATENAVANQQIDTLPREFLGMRAVRERKSELKRLKNSWMSRAKTFLVSLFSEAVDRALMSTEMNESQSYLARAVKETVSGATLELHKTCKSYIGLIDVLIMFDASMAESLAHNYAQNVNRLIDRYVKLICARPIQVLQHFNSTNPQEELEGADANQRNSMLQRKQSTKRKTISHLEKPNEEIPELFSHILDQIMPKISKDCTFCGICFFSKDREGAGRWLEEEPDKYPRIEWSDKDAIKSTIKILLKDIAGDIFDFINQALEMDDAYSIPFMKLISSWIFRLNNNEEHFQTVQWLQEIQAIAISTFNEYMSNHMTLIENPNVFKLLQRKSVKSVWILQYFLKFPRIVEHIELLSQQAEEVANLPEASEEIYSMSSRLIEEKYCIYSEKSFEALEDLASLETKPCHADRLRIENYEFYCSSIGSYQMALPDLSKYFDMASKRKEAAKQRYLQDALEWSAFANAFRFLYSLEKLRNDIPPGDISYQYGFTPNDLLNAISSIPKDLDAIRIQAVSIRNRIQKHFRNDQILFKQMLKEVFREIRANFESLSGNVNECYQGLQTALPWDDIQQMLKDVTN